MKKIGILNQPLSAVVSGLGHLDTVVIADAGLPIPLETERIDLALADGIPSFLETLRVILKEMQVEEAIVAREMLAISPHIYQALQDMLAEVPLKTVDHKAFKNATKTARAVIRTGEFTPYANIILVAGVVF
ncbi:MAG: D-ribose pyranase [Ardenticatenaceae bacterium]|nr:D-ribose pyranase [Ardenticatenaceae bacterium]